MHNNENIPHDIPPGTNEVRSDPQTSGNYNELHYHQRQCSTMGNPPNDPGGSSSGSSSSSDKPKRYDRKATPWDEDTSDGMNNTSSDEDDHSDNSSDSWPEL